MTQPKRLKIGLLVTRALQDHASPDKQIGQFDLPVIVDEILFHTSGDKKGFIRTAVAAHLASAILDTEVPVEYWTFIPETKIAKAFNWPDFMPMGGR